MTVKDKEKSKSDADLSVGELRHLQIRHSQISSLNNFFRQKLGHVGGLKPVCALGEVGEK